MLIEIYNEDDDKEIEDAVEEGFEKETEEKVEEKLREEDKEKLVVKDWETNMRVEIQEEKEIEGGKNQMIV